MAVKLGDFVVSHPENGKVWIVNSATGEGGRFTVEQVDEALIELWIKHF